MYTNLHTLRIEKHLNKSQQQKDHSTKTSKIECYFKNIEETLIEKILEADVVLGCVAWLTNENIMKALQKVKGGVNIIVQKETFIRPNEDNKYTKNYIQK